MNIILVNDFAYTNGGAGQIALATAQILAEQGHQVVLFTAVGPVAGELRNIPRLRVVCTHQHDILHDPNRLRAVTYGIWNPVTRRAFAELLQEFSPQDTVIHVHALQKAISTSILPVAHQRGFRVLFHLHDYGVACPNLGFFDYPAQKICHRRAMGIGCVLHNCDRRSYPQKLWRVLRQYVQKSLGGLPAKTDAFAYISDYSMRFLKPYLPQSSHLYYLPNPINVECGPRVEAEKNQTYLFVGRLSKEKNPQLLARASADLHLPVTFVGSGELAEEIKQLNPNAKIAGWISHDNLPDYYRKARALVFPSIWGETLGLTALEAMAYGLPVIVSDECAAADEIVDGVTGLHFCNNDVDSLKKKIQMLQQDELVQRMSIQAYKDFWAKQAAKESYAQMLENVYQKELEDVK